MSDSGKFPCLPGTSVTPTKRWPALHWYCLLGWLIAAAHLLDLSRLRLERTLPAYLAEDGPFQNLQLLVLAGALGLCLLGLGRFRDARRGALVFLVGPLFYLFWREADWDKDHFSALLGAQQGVRLFSWRYLWSGSEVPTLLKVLWGGVSLGLLAAWLRACWRVRTTWPTLTRLVKTPPVRFWLVLTLGCLGLSQMVERIGLVPHVPGVRDPYWEEALELLGELALLSFMILLFETARMNPPAPAPPGDRTAERRGAEPSQPEREAISSGSPIENAEPAEVPGSPSGCSLPHIGRVEKKRRRLHHSAEIP